MTLRVDLSRENVRILLQGNIGRTMQFRFAVAPDMDLDPAR